MLLSPWFPGTLKNGIEAPILIADARSVALVKLATNVFLELNGATVHFSDNEIFSLLREVQQGYLATNELAHRLHTRIGPAQG